MGSFELIDSSEIVLYGGFNDGPLNKTYFFKVNKQDAEGEIKTHSESQAADFKAPLAEKDFFVVHGIQIRTGEHQNEGKDETLIIGHNHIHAFNRATKTFRTIKQENAA